MQIAVDCRYVRERPSGIGTYVGALVARLPREAPADRFLFWAHRLAPRPLSGAPNVREVTVPVEPNALWTILWPKRYASFAGVDLFHSPHTILPRGLPCATVVTIQDLAAIEAPHLHRSGLDGAVKRLYYARSVRYALRHATRLILATAAMADRVAALWPPSRARIAVVPFGVEAAFAPASSEAEVRRRVRALVGSDDPYLLVIGQDSPTKRHAIAVRAFASGAPPPWRLVLLQRERKRQALGPLAHRLGVAERISWLGAVEPSDVVALLQGAGGLLQPSSYEGFGLPMLEAMACGCPVVASDLPTVREVVGNAALLVPPADGAAFARAVAALAGSAELRGELAGRGLTRARDFSWDRCARDTLEVYRSAVRFE
jgi:glycosyltransferase involved in cell wall biosynthesis